MRIAAGTTVGGLVQADGAAIGLCLHAVDDRCCAAGAAGCAAVADAAIAARLRNKGLHSAIAGGLRDGIGLQRCTACTGHLARAGGVAAIAPVGIGRGRNRIALECGRYRTGRGKGGAPGAAAGRCFAKPACAAIGGGGGIHRVRAGQRGRCIGIAALGGRAGVGVAARAALRKCGAVDIAALRGSGRFVERKVRCGSTAATGGSAIGEAASAACGGLVKTDAAALGLGRHAVGYRR